jgi:hypothetical protein
MERDLYEMTNQKRQDIYQNDYAIEILYTHHLLEILWIWRLYTEAFFANWMDKTQYASMEHLTSNTLMTSHVGVDLLVSVCLVSEDRTADIREVYSDLMGTPRLDTTLEQRKYREAGKFGSFGTFIFYLFVFNYLIVCHRALSRLVNSYLRFITSILNPEESNTDRICRLRWHATDESMIDLLYLVILEISEEGFECWFFLRDQDTSTRITIDTMDECRTEGETIIFPFEIIMYLIDQIGFCSFVIS